MTGIRELIEQMALHPFIEHEDVTKCGQCWREKIKSEVANEFLKKNKLSQQNLKEMFEVIEERWKQTELYLRVQEMRKEGKTVEQIAKELEAEGIEI